MESGIVIISMEQTLVLFPQPFPNRSNQSSRHMWVTMAGLTQWTLPDLCAGENGWSTIPRWWLWNVFVRQCGNVREKWYKHDVVAVCWFRCISQMWQTEDFAKKTLLHNWPQFREKCMFIYCLHREHGLSSETIWHNSPCRKPACCIKPDVWYIHVSPWLHVSNHS